MALLLRTPTSWSSQGPRRAQLEETWLRRLEAHGQGDRPHRGGLPLLPRGRRRVRGPGPGIARSQAVHHEGGAASMATESPVAMTERRPLGRSGPSGSRRWGLGTWAWGSRYVWGYGRSFSLPTSRRRGAPPSSPRQLGRHCRGLRMGSPSASSASSSAGPARRSWSHQVLPAAPHALGREEAAERSLRRLGVGAIDLYQVHWPTPSTIGATMRRW